MLNPTHTSSPTDALFKYARLYRRGNPANYTAAEADFINTVLGKYEKRGIGAALLKVLGLDEQLAIRYDPFDVVDRTALRRDSIKDGNMFLYFDLYEILLLIVKSELTVHNGSKSFSYQAFAALPIAPIYVYAPSSTLEETLADFESYRQNWVEVIPELLVPGMSTNSAAMHQPIEGFSQMPGAGIICCLDCCYKQHIVSFTHGAKLSDCASGYQCQSCGILTKRGGCLDEVIEGGCECGGTLSREHTIFCPKCRSKEVIYQMEYIT
ncbi:hypothetical protein [Allopusillimonas ginsengisoli]|uniref:hypothetical protein n=1 Tax=Allopusillimonas ginsengisoli TaxID=453575 RepID=UPI00101F27DC|nr:hypothetical protein [Allopusillimonas ginsengisoli]TEA79317.1 hypothetical protein ERE07_08070 [Allopusillimonas ginsengisoli]